MELWIPRGAAASVDLMYSLSRDRTQEIRQTSETSSEGVPLQAHRSAGRNSGLRQGRAYYGLGRVFVAQRGLWPQPKLKYTQPSPPWGRGWTAAGAFSSWRGPGEGVRRKALLKKQDFTVLQCRARFLALWPVIARKCRSVTRRTLRYSHHVRTLT